MTESEFDKWLSEKAQEEDFQVPEEFHNRLNELVQSLVADPAYPQQVKKNKAVPAAIWVAGALAAATVTAKAAVDILHERMAAMPDSEIDKNVSELEGATEEADTFSRDFSEQEKERYKELFDRYKHGLQFPEGELTSVTYEEEAAGKEGIIFLTKSRRFLIPERALTDEELLQIIDFVYKRDYSLSEVDSSRDEHTWEAGAVTEEEAIRIAEGLLEPLWDIKAEECERRTELGDGRILIIFQKDEFECCIQVQGSTGQIVAFETKAEKVRDTAIPVDEKLYENKYKEIYHLLKSGIGLTDSIEAAFCRYGIKEKDATLYGTVIYCFEVKGQYYIFQYNTENDQIQDMSIEELEYHKSAMELSNKILKEKFGVDSKRIDFVLPDTEDERSKGE